MDNRDPNNPVKEYTGVWIPKEVMECEELSPTEKITYGEIACFDECYASNAWLAKRICRSEGVASKAVAKLIELGFVENAGFNGRFRVVRVVKNRKAGQKRQGRLVKNDKADSSKMTNIDKSKDKSKDNTLTKVKEETSEIVSGEIVEEKKSYGNATINELFQLWEDKCGFPIKNKVQLNRFACQRLIKSRGIEPIRAVLAVLPETFDDRYAPSVKNFMDLEEKWDNLRLWYRKKVGASRPRTVVQDGVEYTYDQNGKVVSVKI